MKLVREHIFEKFTEESDPVKDMGIGLSNIIAKYEKKTGNYLSKDGPRFLGSFLLDLNYNEFEKDLIIPLLKYILRKNIDVNKPGTYIAYRAFDIRDKEIKNEVIKLLVEAGLNITPGKIFEYCTKEDYELMKYLFELGLEKRKDKPEKLQKFKNRMLIEAAKNNMTEIAEWALELGVEPANDGYEALKYALEHRNKELAKTLAKKLANDPNYK